MALKDFALDPDTGDLLIFDSSFQFVEGAQAVVQKLAMTFAIQKGEWFLDLRFGVPYRDAILVKAPDLDAISRLLRKTIEDVEEIEEVRKFELLYDPAARTLALNFSAVTSEGVITVESAPTPLKPWGFVIVFRL